MLDHRMDDGPVALVVKPEGPVARRGDYRFDRGEHFEAEAMIRAWHYAASCANTSTVRTVMRHANREGWAGAALWMPPTANAARALARRLLGSEERRREVLVLSRLVVAPSEPKNAASLLLGRTFRDALLDRRFSLFVTYADERLGHDGTIYRATGWTFDGWTRREDAWLLDGRLVSRLATKSLSYEAMRAMGCERVSSRKRRFIKLRC